MTADEALGALLRFLFTEGLVIGLSGLAFFLGLRSWWEERRKPLNPARDYVEAEEDGDEPDENEARVLVRTGSAAYEPARTSLSGLSALQNAALAELLAQRDAPALARFLATFENLSGNNIEAMVKGTRSDILKIVQETRKAAEAPPLVVRDHNGTREIPRNTEVVS
jgi:hypothetical protein